VLTQLEVETRAAMFDLLRALGGDTQDREASREAGLIEAERLLQMDWLTMISAFSADLPGLIVEYSALEKAAQPHIGGATALRKLVQHEEATLAFCDAELAGRDDSLAEVLAMLREAPKKPTVPFCTDGIRLSVQATVEDVIKSTDPRADGK
jgi:hypothetical protein